MLPVAATCVSIAALAVLLVADKRGSLPLRYASKPIASLGFIAVALAGGGATGGDYGPWILVGLIFGAGGDVALMFEGDRAFLAGLVSFLIGHLAYVVAFAHVVPVGAWATAPAIAPVVGAAVVAVYLWPHLGKMKLPVVVYVLVITAMAIGALAAVTTGERRLLDDDAALLLAVGALAFFASDIAVARQTFVASSFVNRAWGLPAYYGGQLLLAWSTLP
jgi:uncharacterized membrane protein YhhN